MSGLLFRVLLYRHSYLANISCFPNPMLELIYTTDHRSYTTLKRCGVRGGGGFKESSLDAIKEIRQGKTSSSVIFYKVPLLLLSPIVGDEVIKFRKIRPTFWLCRHSSPLKQHPMDKSRKQNVISLVFSFFLPPKVSFPQNISKASYSCQRDFLAFASSFYVQL